MKYKELMKTVALLKDGQIVMIDGLPFSAKRLNGIGACNFCNVDSLCCGDIAEVCFQLDVGSRSIWNLHLECKP